MIADYGNTIFFLHTLTYLINGQGPINGQGRNIQKESDTYLDEKIVKQAGLIYL